MKIRPARDHRQYTKKQRQSARIETYINREAMEGWYYEGEQSQGGLIEYSDKAIEICMMIKIVYQLSYRRAEGLIASMIEAMGYGERVPEYTTMCRRARKLKIEISQKEGRMVLRGKRVIAAVDATGMTIKNGTEWQATKGYKKTGSSLDKWRKLHLLMDVSSGWIMAGSYSGANVNDGQELPMMVEEVEKEGIEIEAICGDMAYDTRRCREAMRKVGAEQRVPPKKTGRLSIENRNYNQKAKEVFEERDQAISFIRKRSHEVEVEQARKEWKEGIGYHARSLVETTMSQIKAYCRDTLGLSG